MLVILRVLLLSFVAELAYAGYTVCVAERRTALAMLATAMIAILKGGLVISFVREPRLIPAVAAGQVVGTYVVLRLTSGWQGSGGRGEP